MTSYDDTDVYTGPTFYYQVFAVDEEGNRSPPSGVASGRLPDEGPLPAPRLTTPASPGHPAAVSAEPITVGGVGTPYTQVELYRNGRYLGSAPTGASQVVLTGVPVAYAVERGADVAPSGAVIAYDTWADGAYAIAIENMLDGSAELLTIPDGYAREAPVLSPDGRRVAVQARSWADYRDHVFVAEVGTGAMRQLDPASASDEYSPSWSPDSNRVAYTRTGSAWTDSVVVADFVGEAPQVVWEDPADTAHTPAWLSKDAVAAVIQPGSWGAAWTLARFDVPGGARTDVVTAPWLDYPFAVSPSLARLAYSGDDPSGNGVLQLLDLTTGATRVVAQGYADGRTLAFSPDEQRLAVSIWNSLQIADLATGRADTLGDLNADRLVWTAGGLVSCSSYDAPATIDWGAPFELTGVALAPGENLFVGVAVDGGGRRSPVSEAVTVTLEAARLPDLAVAAAIRPEQPVVGGGATAWVTVRNVGLVPSVATQVLVRVLASDGSVRAAPPATVGPIAPAGSAAVPVTLDLAGLEGPQQLVATVDPAHAAPDGDRTNDQSSLTFTIAPKGGLSISIEAPAAVPPGGDVTARVSVVNGGDARDVVVATSLVDAAGALVAGAPDAPFAPLPSGGSASFDRVVPAGAALAGNYTLVAIVQEASVEIARATAPVTMLPERLIDVTLASARAAYRADDAVSLDAAIRNLSRNAPLSGATVRFEVLSGDRKVLELAPRAIPYLWLGVSIDLGAEIPAGTLGAGSFVVRGTVEDADGALGVATTSFEVLAEPLLAGALSVAAPGDPPTVKAGVAAAVTATLHNVGSGTALGVTGAVVVLAADGTEAGRLTLDAGDLAPAAQGEHVVVIPAGTLPLGTYGLVLVATYDGRAETLATARLRVVDGRPPTLVLLAPADGSFVRGSVSASIRAVDDASGVVSVRAIEGAAIVPLALSAGGPLDGTWTGTVALAGEGPHELVFSAADAERNDGLAASSAANPIVLKVVSDTIAPDVRIDGVSPGALVNTPVTPVVVATDLNLAGVDARLDGNAFAGGAVEADGDHALSVVATDKAGNPSSALVRFTIDRTPPVVTILGVDEGACLGADVAPVLQVTDAHLDAWSATLDGGPYQAGAILAGERTYHLAVTAADRAGNSVSIARSFTIDKSAPTVEVTGVPDGAVVPGSVSPVVSFDDANLVGSGITLDGVPFTSGGVVTGDGLHRLRAWASDCGGHLTTVDRTFVVDSKLPTITVAGVFEGEITAADVLPVVLVQDANLASFRTTVDGVELPLGGAVIGESTHLLEVTASDLAGNVASTSVHFEIDRTPPTIWASVEDGARYATTVIVDYGADDRNLAEVSATLDGVSVPHRTPVGASGPHLLTVDARDLAGSAVQRTYRFEIAPEEVKYAVEKRILDRHARVLALVPCPSAQADRIEAFLRCALPGVPLSLVRTELDLLVALRTGAHDVILVAGDGCQAERRCNAASPAVPLSPGELVRRTEQELTEAAYRGAGLVVFREGQAAWPQLVEALGLQFQGDEPAGTVSLQASAVSDEMTLSVPNGVELKLALAHAIGEFAHDHGVAAAVHPFGLGAAAVLGFDASRAEPSDAAVRLVAGAVDYVTPEVSPSPRGTVAVGIDVTNQGSAATTTRVREQLDANLSDVDVLAGGRRLDTGELEWLLDQPAGATDRLSYVVRLPPEPGTYRTTTEVASVSGGSARVFGTWGLDLTLARGEAEVAAEADRLAQAIPAKGPDATNRSKIWGRSPPSARTPEAPPPIASAPSAISLGAIAEAKALRTVAPMALRLELDTLLAAWEARP